MLTENPCDSLVWGRCEHQSPSVLWGTVVGRPGSWVTPRDGEVGLAGARESSWASCGRQRSVRTRPRGLGRQAVWSGSSWKFSHGEFNEWLFS